MSKDFTKRLTTTGALMLAVACCTPAHAQHTVQSPEWLRLSSVASATQPYPPEHPVPSYIIFTNGAAYQFVMPSQGMPGFIYQPAIWAYYQTGPERTVSNIDFKAMEVASHTVQRKGNWIIPHVPGAGWWSGISTNETSQEGALAINLNLLANNPPTDGFNFDALLNDGADLDAIRAQAETVMPVGNYVMLGEYGDPPSYNSSMGYLDRTYTPRTTAWADDLHYHHYLGYAINGLDENVAWNYGEGIVDPVPQSVRAWVGAWDGIVWGGLTPWVQPYPGGPLGQDEAWDMMSMIRLFQAHADLHGLVMTPDALPTNQILQQYLAVNVFDASTNAYFTTGDSPGTDKRLYALMTSGYDVPHGHPDYFAQLRTSLPQGHSGDLFTVPYEEGYHWISAGVDGIWPTPVEQNGGYLTISARKRVAVYGKRPASGETISITRYRDILSVRSAAPARLEVLVDKIYSEPLSVELELRREGVSSRTWVVTRPVVDQRAVFDLDHAFEISTLESNDVAFIRLFRHRNLNTWHVIPLLCDEIALDTPEAWAALPQGYARAVPPPVAAPMTITQGQTWVSASVYTNATLEFRARLPAAGTNDTWIGFIDPPSPAWDFEEFAKDTNDMFNLMAWHYLEHSGQSRLQALFDNASGQVEASAGVDFTVQTQFGPVNLNSLTHWGDYLWRHGNQRINAVDPEEYHTYRLEWQRPWQRWYIDGHLVYERRLIQDEPLPVTIRNGGDGDIDIEWLRLIDPQDTYTSFSPTDDLSGCTLWLNAETLALSDGSPVTAWPDASGSGLVADRTGLAYGNAPTYQTNAPANFNGRPTVSFNNAALWTEALAPSIPAQEIFAVVTMDNSGGDTATLMSIGREDAPPFNRVRRDGTADAYADDAVFDFGGGIDGVIRINGAAGTNVTLDAPHIFHATEDAPTHYTNLYLGWDVINGRPWRGQVAEIIAFSNKLTLAERNAVHVYLADKYGIGNVTYPLLDEPPPVTDGLTAWFNAGDLSDIDDGESVAAWRDRSGNDIELNRDGLAYGSAPTYRTNAPGVFNGAPSVAFDNAALWTEASDPTIAAREIFAVVTMDGTAGSIATLASLGREGVPPFNQLRREGTAETYADDAGFDFGGGADGTIRINGARGASISYGVPHIVNATENSIATYTNLYLGWNVVYGRPWKGHVAEILVYDQALTLEERNAVNAYLAEKYGIAGMSYPVPDAPPPIEGLAVWLNANDLVDAAHGDPVTVWEDRSGSGNHVDRTGLGFGSAPTFHTNAPSTFNGRASVAFDGSGLWTESVDPAFEAQDVFSVLTMDGTADSIATLLSVGKEGASPFNQVRRSGTMEAYADDAGFDFGGGGDGTIRINGIAGTEITYGEPHIFSATENSAFTFTNLYLGWNVVWGRPWKGHIAEILIYSNKLSSAERNSVGLYLAGKYGMTNTGYRMLDPLPPVTDDLTVWLNANDLLNLNDGDSVTEWDDRSGNGNHLNRDGLAWSVPPTFRTNAPGVLNGKPAVQFNASALWTEGSAAAIAAQEIIAVVTLDSTSESIATLLSVGKEGVLPFNQVRRNGTAEAYADDAAFDFGGGGDGTIRINGSEATAITYDVPHIYGSTENSSVTYSNLYLGWNVVWGRPWKGYVAELLIYSRSLSASERDEVNLYLADKYGIANIEIGDPPGLIISNAPGYEITWDGNEGDHFDAAAPPGGSLVPDNLALYGTPFASGEQAAYNHLTVKLNDGYYGNVNSWIGNAGPAHAGVLLNGLYAVSSFSFGRDNGNLVEWTQYADRSTGTYTIAFSADSGTNWFTAGTLTYTGAGGEALRGYDFDPYYRHEYQVSHAGGVPIVANAILIQVSHSGILANGVAIDEIEVYGLPISVTGQVTAAFSSSMDGWTNDGGTSEWYAAGGSLRADFGAIGSPAGETAILLGDVSASGGAFVGDYHAADVWAIGFDFVAEDVNPISLILEIEGSGTAYEVELADRLGAPGITNRLIVSLVSRDAGPWSGPADDAVFESVVTNISAVRIHVVRGDLAAEAHRIDNIFIDSLPLAGRMDLHPSSMDLYWEGARPGWVYRLESTDHAAATGAWQHLSTTLATNAVIGVSDTNTAVPHRVYRLTVP